MKYVWLVALLVLMVGTWSLGTPERLSDLKALTERQNEFADLIRKSIHEDQPEATNVNFSQLYLETLVPDRTLRAHYRYQIISKSKDGSESTEQFVEGTSILHSADGGVNWQLTKTDLTEPSIQFSNGVTITPQKAAERDGGVSEPALNQ